VDGSNGEGHGGDVSPDQTNWSGSWGEEDWGGEGGGANKQSASQKTKPAGGGKPEKDSSSSWNDWEQSEEWGPTASAAAPKTKSSKKNETSRTKPAEIPNLIDFGADEGVKNVGGKEEVAGWDNDVWVENKDDEDDVWEALELDNKPSDAKTSKRK